MCVQARLVGDGRNNGESGVEGRADGGVEDGAESRGATKNTAVMTAISAGATLSPLPQNLIDLWQDYIEGIRGRNPFNFFSFS
jgi:hypothetical protein